VKLGPKFSANIEAATQIKRKSCRFLLQSRRLSSLVSVFLNANTPLDSNWNEHGDGDTLMKLMLLFPKSQNIYHVVLDFWDSSEKSLIFVPTETQAA
jgi:hypothetical protein